MAALTAAGAAVYAAHAGKTWLNYGHPDRPAAGAADPLLDLFMPDYEVAERHQITVEASTDDTFAALVRMNLDDSLVVRSIFKAREVLLGADPGDTPGERGLVAATRALGWEVLAEVPGHEIVLGAATKPWEANVIFRGVPPDEFARFDEPGYVKIVWNLRAEPLDAGRTRAATETRVMTTDAQARRRFRWYWAKFSAGVSLIRRVGLQLVKADAERRAAEAHRTSGKSSDTTVPPVGGTSMSIVPP